VSTPRSASVISVNGVIQPRSRATISVHDSALLYGTGLFETFLAVDREVVFLEEHLERLSRGAQALELRLSVSRRTLSRWLKDTVAAHPAGIKRVRLTLTGGTAKRWAGKQGKPQIIVTVTSHKLQSKPLRLTVSDLKIDQDSFLCNIKTTSYTINALAMRQAASRKLDDALLLNYDSEVTEMSSANIFWVKKGTLFTPSLDTGCLEGTTRAFIVGDANRLKIPLREQRSALPTLLSADEVFITSSLKLVTPVTHIENRKKTYRFAPGQITNELSERLREKVLHRSRG